MKTRFTIAVLILLTLPLLAQDYNAFRVYYRYQLARNKIVGSSVFILNDGQPAWKRDAIRTLTDKGIAGQTNWVAKGGWNFFSIVNAPKNPEVVNRMFIDLAKEKNGLIVVSSPKKIQRYSFLLLILLMI